MKITIPHILLLVVVLAVAGCETSTSGTRHGPDTQNDGSMKVNSGPYHSIGSADPQGPREPR